MPTSTTKARLQELRACVELSVVERNELDSLLKAADAEETALLAPATAQLQSQAENIEAQNRSLRLLAERKTVLIARLHALLDEAAAERRAIEEEVSRVLGRAPLHSSTSTLSSPGAGR